MNNIFFLLSVIFTCIGTIFVVYYVLKLVLLFSYHQILNELDEYGTKAKGGVRC